MRQFIRARATVPGLHHWPDAPEEHAPLRAVHRHKFTFEVEAETGHGDRAIEFIDLARRIADEVERRFPRAHWASFDFGSRSCEQLAAEALGWFPEARRVTVWEDMENAGGAERDGE